MARAALIHVSPFSLHSSLRRDYAISRMINSPCELINVSGQRSAIPDKGPLNFLISINHYAHKSQDDTLIDSRPRGLRPPTRGPFPSARLASFSTSIIQGKTMGKMRSCARYSLSRTRSIARGRDAKSEYSGGGMGGGGESPRVASNPGRDISRAASQVSSSAEPRKNKGRGRV